MRPGSERSAVVYNPYIHTISLVLLFAQDQIPQLGNGNLTVVNKQRNVKYQQQYEQSGQPVWIINTEISNQVVVGFGRKIEQ